MDITIDKQLRDLRTKRGNTQEDLANFLNISFQAVSKWERGESLPDIALLPKIAAFYDVSVDELLGVGEIKKQEKIRECRVKDFELARDGLIDERIKLWREAYAEFPNDMEVNEGLMLALYYAYLGKHHDEALALGERILRESTDGLQRNNAIQAVCNIYSINGNKEKAKEYAKMSGHIYSSQEALLPSILDGEECIRQSKQLLLDCLGIILYAENQLCKEYNVEKRLQIYEFSLKLMELFFDDGFYGNFAQYALWRHAKIAKIYITHRNDEQKVFEHLKAAVEFAKQCSDLPDSFAYNSTLLNGYETERAVFGINSQTDSDNLLLFMRNFKFDSVRESYWFKSLVEELETAK